MAKSEKQYVGAAPLTMVRTDPPGYVNVFAGDPVPVNIDEADLERLLAEGFLAEVDAKVTGSKAEKGSASDGKPTSVKDILAAVGNDKVAAQEYLDEENAAEKPRTSLVEGLQGVIDAEA